MADICPYSKPALHADHCKDGLLIGQSEHASRVGRLLQAGCAHCSRATAASLGKVRSVRAGYTSQHPCSQVALHTLWRCVHPAASLLLLRWLKVKPRAGQPASEQAARLHLGSDLKHISWLCATHVDGASHPVAPIAGPCGTHRVGQRSVSGAPSKNAFQAWVTLHQQVICTQRSGTSISLRACCGSELFARPRAAKECGDWGCASWSTVCMLKTISLSRIGNVNRPCAVSRAPARKCVGARRLRRGRPPHR